MKLIYLIILLMTTSCSELLLLSSGAGVIASQSPVVKAYNGADMITIVTTDKDIKKHAYDKLKGEKNKK
jgi:hypothetical protein